ncbi:MAG: enoyl-CoA hydratase/isomerase family protein, partial [Nocardioides sp.]|nr:enoyl-CoA hydratase/isomerase family protein [Nocardioides sp.]
MSTADHGALAPDAVLWESGDGIGRITLNRPDAANAINPEQRNRLIAVLAEAADDPAVRVVLLTSTGKHFCAGADVER